MTIESFEREEALRRKAKRRGFDLRIDRSTSDASRRRWKISRAGTMASDLTLDEVGRWLDEK